MKILKSFSLMGRQYGYPPTNKKNKNKNKLNLSKIFQEVLF